MRLNSKQVTGLPVLTKSGISLGKVGSIDIDVETGRIEAFHVKTRGLVQGLLDEELVVAWSQVVEMNENRVIVQDATVPQGAQVFAQATEGVTGSGPMARNDA